ncbi:WD40-repeat-containing domain protein [Powellomyces hirtus]|nr:WD40-repeat-containing domain protein [Powellomyces hirtus]
MTEQKKLRRCVGIYRGHEGTVYSIDIHGPAASPVMHTKVKKQRSGKILPEQDREASTHREDAVTLVSGSHDQNVMLWDVKLDMAQKGELTAQIKPEKTLNGHNADVYAVELVNMPHGPLHALSAGDSSVRFWNLETGEIVRSYTGHTNHVSCLKLKGKRAFSGSWDTTLRSWNLETGKPMHIFHGHTNIVNTIDVTDTDVYSGGWDTNVIQWCRSTGEPVATYRGHTDGVQCLQSHGELLLSGSMDKTIRVWNQKTVKTIRILKGHEGGVECLQAVKQLCFSGSYDKTIRCFKINTGECIAVFEGHTDGVYCLKFYNDIIFSGSGDKTIRLWDARGLVPATSIPWWRRILSCSG